MKSIMVLALLAILAALAAAGFFMLRPGRANEEPSKRMARALALRVGLSIALFAGILLAYKMGWISPTGVPLAR